MMVTSRMGLVETRIILAQTWHKAGTRVGASGLYHYVLRWSNAGRALACKLVMIKPFLEVPEQGLKGFDVDMRNNTDM